VNDLVLILPTPCVGGGTGVLGAMLVMFSYRFALCNGKVFLLNGNIFPAVIAILFITSDIFILTMFHPLNVCL
jgi:hypothetical protein